MPRRNRLDRSAGTATCPRSEGVRSRRTTGLRGAVVRTDGTAAKRPRAPVYPWAMRRASPIARHQLTRRKQSQQIPQGSLQWKGPTKQKSGCGTAETCRIDQRCSQRGHALPLRAGQNWRCSRRFGRDNRGSGLRFVRVERTSLRPPRRPGRLIEQVPSNQPNRETLFLA